VPPSRFAFRVRLDPASRWDPAETGFVVTFPDWEVGATQGEDEADALAAAADALEEMVASAIRRGEPIPVSSAEPGEGERWVEVGGLLAAKAALAETMREQGVSSSALARRLGCDEKEVRRMLDPRHPTRLSRLDAALRALGRRLVVDVRDAA
jgi:antitoxin HicB